MRNTEFIGYCTSAGKMFEDLDQAEAKFNEVSHMVCVCVCVCICARERSLTCAACVRSQCHIRHCRPVVTLTRRAENKHRIINWHSVHCDQEFLPSHMHGPMIILLRAWVSVLD